MEALESPCKTILNNSLFNEVILIDMNNLGNYTLHSDGQ
jgi:hypothetical protein